MKNILFTLVLWLFTFTASAQQSWQVVGENNEFPEDSGIGLAPGGGVLTLDNNGIPYVVYATYTQENYYYYVFVRKFENDSWQYVGNMLYVDTIFISASMAFDSNNIPYLAYKDFSNSSVITVKKLENGVWENVGTGAISSNWSANCVLALDNNDVPYVFYGEASDSYKATVKKFENDSWQVVGQAGFSIEQIRLTSMVFDDNDVPYVAYSDDGNDNTSVFIKKLENNSWLPVGDEAGIPVTTYSFQNELFIGSNNTLYIAYRSYVTLFPSYISEVGFKKYINNEWQQAGEFISEEAGAVSFGLYNDIPYVAYTNDENENNTVIRLENDNWQAVGEEGFSEGMAAVRLTINNNGILFAAFINYTNGYRITVMKYDNTMGVDEHTTNNILLYPNPANGMVNIANISENSTIKVFDSIGKLVYNLQANQQITIDTAELSNGIYLVQIIADNQRIITKKLVVNKH